MGRPLESAGHALEPGRSTHARAPALDARRGARLPRVLLRPRVSFSGAPPRASCAPARVRGSGLPLRCEDSARRSSPPPCEPPHGTRALADALPCPEPPRSRPRRAGDEARCTRVGGLSGRGEARVRGPCGEGGERVARSGPFSFFFLCFLHSFVRFSLVVDSAYVIATLYTTVLLQILALPFPKAAPPRQTGPASLAPFIKFARDRAQSR